MKIEKFMRSSAAACDDFERLGGRERGAGRNAGIVAMTTRENAAVASARLS
jgi:hypothetical protein